MRIRVSSIVAVSVALVATACGSTVDRSPTVDPAASPATHTVAPARPPTLAAVPLDHRPVWEGFDATRAGDLTLAARAHGALAVYPEPEAPEPAWTLEATTILGTVTVLGVVAPPVDGWVEVMLPVRPNGSTGWVRSDHVSLYVADSRIVVDLGARELAYVVDGVTVLETEVGVGSQYNQTPPGEYFVTDSVTLADPNSPWGPHALGLSARSETITSYNGGDGIIGIHGTNNPSSIGGSISLGCVRLPNDMITALHSMVPIGTRVEIRA